MRDHSLVWGVEKWWMNELPDLNPVKTPVGDFEWMCWTTIKTPNENIKLCSIHTSGVPAVVVAQHGTKTLYKEWLRSLWPNVEGAQWLHKLINYPSYVDLGLGWLSLVTQLYFILSRFPIKKVYAANAVFCQTSNILILILYTDNTCLGLKSVNCSKERDHESIGGQTPARGRVKVTMKKHKSFLYLECVCTSKVMMQKGAGDVQQKTRPFWQHRGLKRVSKRVKDKEKEQQSSQGLKMDWGHENKGHGSQIKFYLSKERSVVTLQTHFKQDENWSKSKGDNTYWKVKGFVKNMKESTIVMAFLPVVTAKEWNIHVTISACYISLLA